MSGESPDTSGFPDVDRCAPVSLRARALLTAPAGDQQALEYRKSEELTFRRLRRGAIRQSRLLLLRPPMEVVQERKRVPFQQSLCQRRPARKRSSCSTSFSPQEQNCSGVRSGSGQLDRVTLGSPGSFSHQLVSPQAWSWAAGTKVTRFHRLAPALVLQSGARSGEAPSP